MPKFEKEFVYFMWDDSLLGKKVFYSNSIDTLQEYVEKNSKDSYEVVTQQGYSDAPFWIDGTGSNGNCSWIFAYYDPNYETKLAHEKGKAIQYKIPHGEWIDTETPAWAYGYTYRVKPVVVKKEKPITNRELARWIALGNGEWKYKNDCFHSVKFSYPVDVENTTIEDMILVRKWEDKDWVYPTREYMGLED